MKLSTWIACKYCVCASRPLCVEYVVINRATTPLHEQVNWPSWYPLTTNSWQVWNPGWSGNASVTQWMRTTHSHTTNVILWSTCWRYRGIYMYVHMSGTRPCLDELVQHQQQMSFDKMLLQGEIDKRTNQVCLSSQESHKKERKYKHAKYIRAKTKHKCYGVNRQRNLQTLYEIHVQ